MKKNTRLTAILLAMLMAIGTLISCGSNDATQQAQSSEQSQSSSENLPSETEPEEETRANHGVDTEALDFGGENLVSAVYNWGGYLYYFFADEETGDAMNDAIYHRRMKVEEDLGITMITARYTEGEYIDQIKKLFFAGDHAFDLMFNHCIQDIATYAAEGYLYNLDTLPYIDMTAEWWDQEQMDNLRLGKNTYYAVNDMMIPNPYIITFNKDIIANNQFDNPHTLVAEGKWTLDAFTTLAKNATSDADGNGVMDRDDYWGIIRVGSANLGFMSASDQFLTGRDGDNRVVITMKTEKMQNLVETFVDLASNAMYFTPEGETRPTLNENNILFELLALSSAEQIRDYDINVGILPYPKYDEAQTEYKCLDWGGLLSISGLITNPDMVGAAMELLAWESANEVIPTYFDRILSGKLARDEEDRDMLELIFDSIVYDNGASYFGFAPGVEPLYYTLLRQAIDAKSTNYTSHYEANIDMANKSIADFYEKLDKVETPAG